MLNKLISLLILIFTFWVIYGFYYYFFVLNKWKLILNWNTSNYIASLYSEKFKINFTTTCKNEKCELIDLAPFDYTLTISKEWFKEIKKDIKILSKQSINFDFKLEKQLIIKKEKTLNEDSQNQLKKFREIASLQQKSYKSFNLDDLGYFYFIDNWDNTITLFRKKTEEKNLYTFKKIPLQNVEVFKVYDDESFVFISLWEEKYIYDFKDDSIEKIFFPQDINYIKKSGNFFHLINEKWTFLYDSETKNIEYFYLFKDFIPFDEEHYLWVIFDDETEKKKNYNLENQEWNLIIKYNFKTKTIQVLQKIESNIQKITKEESKIYFYDEFDEKYLIDNI